MSGPLPSAWKGWEQAGYKTLRREVVKELPRLPAFFPPSLAILVPDIARAGYIPLPSDLCFFDLETTGLSGGAGTIAFLSAFGRFMPDDGCLSITQYLLLDYPGEPDFMKCALAEFSRPRQGGASPFFVSYNGKTFDSQILKNRFIVSGSRPPGYLHADLLHPARRLWKRLLPDCSQATIETSVLGLDRTGDISGAFAPEIWFSFLRGGDNGDLLSVCDHNLRDISGLASLFLCLVEIAANPLNSRFRFDAESLAFVWKKTLAKSSFRFGEGEIKTGAFLLERAAKDGFPRAAFTFALDRIREGRVGEGRALLSKLAEDSPPKASGARAAALRALAIDAEWRLADCALALSYTSSALALGGVSDSGIKELEKRRARLEAKLAARGKT